MVRNYDTIPQEEAKRARLFAEQLDAAMLSSQGQSDADE